MGIAGHRAEESQRSVRLAGKCGEVVGLPRPIEHNPGPIPLGQFLGMEGTQGSRVRSSRRSSTSGFGVRSSALRKL